MSETEAVPQPVVETAITLTADLAISYAAIITMAIVPIVLGSRKAAEALNLDALVSSVSTSQNLSVKMETMSKKDATMFPVIGSGVLLGLYLLFHFFSKEYINYLLSAYFFIFGISALASSFTPFVVKFFPLSDQTQVPFPNFLKKIVELVLRTKLACSLATLIAMIPATIIATVYGITKNWLLNNLLGLCFSVEGVALLSPGSFKIAAQLLIGLFLYDIFWVFGTDVMVTVAKNFDAPIKLLFPKNLLSGEEFKFAMLGLGDIVIPGIFIAMMLRFDISRAINDAKKSGKKLTFSSIPKPYYNSTLVAYFLGLATTIGVMHLFRHAQPALLYLVPFCLLFPVLTSLVRGEFSLLFQYAEDNEDEQEEKEKNEKAAASDAATTTTTTAETKKTD